MGERTNRLRSQVKEHPVLVGTGLLVTLLSGVNVTSVVATIDTVGGLASKEYVAAQLGAHAADESRRLSEVEKGLDRIRAFTEFAPQIRDLITLRCMGVPNLDTPIATLEREFAALAGEPFREPPCERLVLPPR